MEEDKQAAAHVKEDSETLGQITEQPLITELDREHPEQIPPGKLKFINRIKK